MKSPAQNQPPTCPRLPARLPFSLIIRFEFGIPLDTFGSTMYRLEYHILDGKTIVFRNAADQSVMQKEYPVRVLNTFSKSLMRQELRLHQNRSFAVRVGIVHFEDAFWSNPLTCITLSSIPEFYQCASSEQPRITMSSATRLSGFSKFYSLTTNTFILHI